MAKTVEDGGERLRKEARSWLDRIDASTKSEKLWMDDADKAVSVYTSECGKDSPGGSVNPPMFNILFSNVETIVPATINSPPAPDIRRRFETPDPVAQDYAEILERTMRIQVDDGRLQTEMEAEAQDAFLAGRGLMRLRFKSDFEADASSVDTMKDDIKAERPELDEDDAAAAPPAERTQNERIEPEVVSWRDFRHGPAKRWADVPWIAFSHSLAMDEYKSFCDGDMVLSQEQPGDHRTTDEAYEEVKVWEIWDRPSRSVIFVDEEKVRIIKRVPDPLGLSKFFPIHDPVQPIEVTGRLMPVNPYKIYVKLAEELDLTTKRIAAITKQLKVKGWYAGSETDMGALLNADDNEFVPVQDEAIWAAKGGIESAIGFWPVDKLVTTLRELYVLREQTKAAIYEITGISDIIRGASKSSETATAQNIKSQWGSLRIQKMQRQLERAGRELFLMMAEIIPAKFSYETLQKITGIQIVPNDQDMQPVPAPPPPMLLGMSPEQAQQAQQQHQQAVQQAQQAEQRRQEKLQHLMQLQALMRERPSTYFRIDVETDSTVRADLTRQKQDAAEFMGAASRYFAAVGPLVQQGMLPMELAVELFSGFTRLYNLGKTVDDALDTLVKQAKEKAGQPQQQQQPNPDQIKAQVEAKAKEQDMKFKAETHQVDMQQKQQQIGMDMQAAALDRETKKADLQIKQNNLAISNMEMQLKQAQLAAALNLAPVPNQPFQPSQRTI